MKFAFIIFKYFPFGGMQRDMLRTANELVKRGHQVEIFTLSWQDDAPKGIGIHVLPQKGLLNFMRYQRFINSVFEYIGANAFDYIFGYNRMVGLDAHFAADPCFVERAERKGGLLYRLNPRHKWFASCEKAIFSSKSTTQVLAVSMTEKPNFQDWYGTQDERFHYIPPYLSPDRFKLEDKKAMRALVRRTFNFSSGDFVYMLTGSGFAIKGLDRAILAMAALPQKLLKRTKLLAVGQDNPKQFMAMAEKLGIKDHVVISKGRPDIPKLMQGADVCVHPAYRENTGLVILEAMACGAPILVTESCGYARHVKEAKAGLVNALPFNQDQFNAQWLVMRESRKKPKWSKNGLAYVETIMQANDGGAEAEILIRLANVKQHKVS